MTYSDSFDDFLATDRMADTSQLPPFQFREKKDEKSTLEWLTQNFDNNEEAAHGRRIYYRRYQALYKNIQWKHREARDSRRDNEDTGRRPRHSVNFIREMVDNRVAQNARMKHNLAFVPSNDEQSDVNNAKLCKIMYDGYAEENELEMRLMFQDQVTFLFGHSLMYICWKDDIGPKHPAYEKLLKDYPEGIPKELKKQFKGKEIHVGDVETTVIGPDKFYVERDKEKWEDIDHLEIIDTVHIEKLKADYPKKAIDIKENQREMYDFDASEMIRPKNEVVVRTFWHRPTKYLPEGAKITYTDDVILDWVEFPYSHGMLPAIPEKDVDVYGEFWGRSFIADIEQMQRFYNAMQSAQARDFSLASAPKWMLPKGACDVNTLNNDLTIVEWSGPVAPQLVTHNFTPNASLELQDRVEKKISQHSKVYDISRGEVPSGVTANSALRFLDEQESQIILPQETKRKRRVIRVARMILSLMQQYYKADDGRTVRLIGSKNEYLIKSMAKADFSKVYDVKAQNSSALPDTKTGKIAAIIDLNMATQTDPVFRKEEVIQMMDLGMDERFKDRASVAADAANTAFDALLNGEEIAPPAIFDELLVHYSIFTKGIQTFSFKEKVGTEIQQRVDIHMKTMEMHIFERCRRNIKFCSEVLELDNYPMFFKVPMPITKVMALHQQDSMGMMPPESGGGSGMDTSKVEKPTE